MSKYTISPPPAVNAVAVEVEADKYTVVATGVS